MKRFVGLFLLLFVIPGMVLYADNHFNLHHSGTMTGGIPGDGFGWIVRNVGDVNNDGSDDLAITTPYGVDNDGTLIHRDLVNIYYASADFDTVPDLSFHSKVTDILGHSDLNGDGFDDLVMADFTKNVGGIFEAGEIRIHFGTATGLDTVPAITIDGAYFYFHFGASLAVGDINGDGYDDLMVAAPMDDYWPVGRVYIYYGGSTMDTTPDWYFQPSPQDTTNWGALYGESIACGDLNNDGYAEFAIGVPYSLNEDQPGRVYVYQGGVSPDTIPDIICSGDNLDTFGRQILYIPPQTQHTYGSFLLSGNVNDNLPYNQHLLLLSGADTLTHSTQQVITNPYNPTDPMAYEGQIFFQNYGFGDWNGDGQRDLFITGRRFGFPGYVGGEGGIPDVYLYSGPIDVTAPDTTLYFADTLSAYAFAPAAAIDLNQDGVSELLFNRVVDPTGDWHDWEYFVDVYSAQPFNITAIKSNNVSPLPNQFELLPAYPNPFNEMTTISFQLIQETQIRIHLYNALGKEVDQIMKSYHPGLNMVTWTPTHLSSGIYFIKVTNKSEALLGQQKVIYLK